MRKFSVFFLLIACLSLVLTTPAHADRVDASTIVAQEIQISNNFTFEQLGFIEKAMVGPYDSLNLFFGLPANVTLAPGGIVTLKFSVSGANYLSENVGANWLGGTLLVYFNRELIDTIVLDTLGEEISKDIEIPAPALATQESDGRHRLQLILSADLHCDITDTLLLINKNSSFELQYQTVSPARNLSLLPQPIFQLDSILPNRGYIVVPDNPEDYELQAAMSVAAGLGSMTEGKLDVSLLTDSALSADVQAANHLIFVGLAEKFPDLQSAAFPVAITSEGAILSPENSEDGIIQISESPWGSANVIVFVGGNSKDAVIKAGQAFSSGRIVAVDVPDLSVVSDTNPFEATIVGVEDYTFEDLGYETATVGLFGDDYLSYNFYVSPEQAVSTGAYLDLVVAHSELLNLDATGVTILLNDEIIGGIRLDEETPKTVRVDLIPDVLRRGINRLEIITEIVPYFTCYSSNLQSTWLTVSSSSSIHLPVSVQQIEAGEKIDLQDFPYMLLDDVNLSDLAIILAQGDPVSWDYAAKVAFYIGVKGNASLANLLVAYGDNVSETTLENYNLLIFGRATNLPIISQLSGSMPAPFPNGSDVATQPEMPVNYSILPDTSVGYLELAQSPYNPERTILAILGNTDSGIPMAGVVLTNDELVSQLSGNFAMLFTDQIVATDTRLGSSAEELIALPAPAAPSVETSALEAPQPADIETEVEGRPAWILPVFIAITVLILVFLVFMLRKEANPTVTSEEDGMQEDDDTPSQ